MFTVACLSSIERELDDPLIIRSSLVIILEKIWESISCDDTLGGNSSNGAHGQSSVQKFGGSLLVESFLVRRSPLRPSEVTGISLAIHGCGTGRCGDDKIEETDPHEKLDHRSLFDQDVVSANGLRDRVEAVHFTGDAKEIGGDESDNSQHL